MRTITNEDLFFAAILEYGIDYVSGYPTILPIVEDRIFLATDEEGKSFLNVSFRVVYDKERSVMHSFVLSQVRADDKNAFVVHGDTNDTFVRRLRYVDFGITMNVIRCILKNIQDVGDGEFTATISSDEFDEIPDIVTEEFMNEPGKKMIKNLWDELDAEDKKRSTEVKKPSTDLAEGQKKKSTNTAVIFTCLAIFGFGCLLGAVAVKAKS